MEVSADIIMTHDEIIKHDWNIMKSWNIMKKERYALFLKKSNCFCKNPILPTTV